MLAAGGKGNLKRWTVMNTWRKAVDEGGASGQFASRGGGSSGSSDGGGAEEEAEEEEEEPPPKRAKGKGKAKAKGKKVIVEDDDDDEDWQEDDDDEEEGEGEEESKYQTLNKVKVNKGDPEASRQAKAAAKAGKASLAVRGWLFAPKPNAAKVKGGKRPMAKESLLRFSDVLPPKVCTRETIEAAVVHLSEKDPKLEALIMRIGPDALYSGSEPKPPTQARLFDQCIRAMTFTMISVAAGESFLKRLAIKCGVCIERMPKPQRKKLLEEAVKEIHQSDEYPELTADVLLERLLDGNFHAILLTCGLIKALVQTCDMHKGKRVGWPHLCGVSRKCGKGRNPDQEAENIKGFLEAARAHAAGGPVPVSAGYSNKKASFIISMVDSFESGKISGEKLAKASDREAMKMLCGLQGIGEWSAGSILVHWALRADIMLYGDLTIRNYLNDLYNIAHREDSETLVQSAADFNDTGPNRNAIDAVAEANGWAPYRSVVCLMMYHLQEDNLVLV